MKPYPWNKILLSFAMALAMLPALAACGQSPASSAAAPSAELPAAEAPAADAPVETTGPAPAEPAETPTPEWTISDIILLGGEKTEVFLDVSDGEIQFWDQPSAGSLLAVAKYPEALPGAAEALECCDFTDLDSDGNSDLTASFLFGDGRTASLVWFFSSGGYIYNEEFSQLPGDASMGE